LAPVRERGSCASFFHADLQEFVKNFAFRGKIPYNERHVLIFPDRARGFFFGRAN